MPTDGRPLSDSAAQLYAWFLARGGTADRGDVPEELAPFVAELSERYLLSPGPENTLGVVDPHLAMIRFGSARYRDALRHARAAEALPELVSRLSAALDEGGDDEGAAAAGGFEVVCDPQAADTRIRALLAGATSEVLAVRHGITAGRPQPWGPLEAVAADPAGARVKVLLRTSECLAPTKRAHARALHDLGAEVRVTELLAGQLLVVDGRAAVLPDCGEPDQNGRRPTAFVLESSVVQHLDAAFAHFWESAGPFPLAGPTAEVYGSLQESIVQLLRQGVRQQDIGRTLGLSTRTVTAQIDRLKRQYRVESLFTLGVAIERERRRSR